MAKTHRRRLSRKKTLKQRGGANSEISINGHKIVDYEVEFGANSGNNTGPVPIAIYLTVGSHTNNNLPTDSMIHVGNYKPDKDLRIRIPLDTFPEKAKYPSDPQTWTSQLFSRRMSKFKTELNRLIQLAVPQNDQDRHPLFADIYKLCTDLLKLSLNPKLVGSSVLTESACINAIDEIFGNSPPYPVNHAVAAIKAAIVMQTPDRVINYGILGTNAKVSETGKRFGESVNPVYTRYEHTLRIIVQMLSQLSARLQAMPNATLPVTDTSSITQYIYGIILHPLTQDKRDKIYDWFKTIVGALTDLQGRARWTDTWVSGNQDGRQWSKLLYAVLSSIREKADPFTVDSNTVLDAFVDAIYDRPGLTPAKTQITAVITGYDVQSIPNESALNMPYKDKPNAEKQYHFGTTLASQLLYECIMPKTY